MGMQFGFVVEKNPDLPAGDPRRKFKGRVVFQGNNVVNQNWEAAMLQDLGNAPATMEASRIADCYGCFPGHACQQADAGQAHLQAPLKGTPTWVALPPDQRPASWAGMKRRACRLLRALYGHPDSGTYWEEHCDARVLKAGFEPVLRDTWPACYYCRT